MEVKLFPLEVWQKDVLNTFIAHQTNTIITVNSPRQCGKSICVEAIIIWASLNKRGVSMFVSPTLAQARKVYQDIIRIIDGTPIMSKKNDSLLEITFCNGSTCYFKSAEMRDGLRGYTISNVLIIDEASFVSDATIYELLLPMTNVHKATMILTSTPKFKTGAFYKNYMLGMSPDVKGHKNITIDWTSYDLSKFLPEDMLEMYKQQLPKLIFQSEYLGQFIDGDSVLFNNIKECVKESVNIYNKPIFSIDWASGSGKDYTVISILSKDNEDKIYLHRQYAFNDKNTNQTINYILELVKMYEPEKIVVESNSIGKVFYDALRDKVYEYTDSMAQKNVWNGGYNSIAVKAISTSNASKDRWVKSLAKRFEDCNIEIPNDRELINQLSVYECKVSSTGLPTYNAPAGYHDDRTMSLLIGVNELLSGRYAC